jgi:rubrerythrin
MIQAALGLLEWMELSMRLSQLYKTPRGEHEWGVGRRAGEMAWYCPECGTEFPEYQPICPFCNVTLRRSKRALE